MYNSIMQCKIFHLGEICFGIQYDRRGLTHSVCYHKATKTGNGAVSIKIVRDPRTAKIKSEYDSKYSRLRYLLLGLAGSFLRLLLGSCHGVISQKLCLLLTARSDPGMMHSRATWKGIDHTAELHAWCAPVCQPDCQSHEIKPKSDRCFDSKKSSGYLEVVPINIPEKKRVI